MGRSPIVATLMPDNVNDGRAGSAAGTTFGFGCPPFVGCSLGCRGRWRCLCAADCELHVLGWCRMGGGSIASLQPSALKWSHVARFHLSSNTSL